MAGLQPLPLLLLPLLLLPAALGPARVGAQEPEARRGGGGGLLPPDFLGFHPEFSSLASSQAFSRGGAASRSEASSRGGVPAFSKSYSLGSDGQSSSKASSQHQQAASEAAGQSLRRPGLGGSSAYSKGGSLGERTFSESGSSSSSRGSGQSFSQSSSTSTGSSSSSSSLSSSTSSGGPQLFGGSHQATHLSPHLHHGAPVGLVAELPVLNRIVPLAVEGLFPTAQDEPFLLTTPVPIIEEVSILPVGLPVGNAVFPPEPPHFGHLALADRQRVGVYRGHPQQAFGHSAATASSASSSGSRQQQLNRRDPIVHIGYQGDKPTQSTHRQPQPQQQQQQQQQHEQNHHRQQQQQGFGQGAARQPAAAAGRYGTHEDKIREYFNALQMQKAHRTSSMREEHHRENHHRDSGEAPEEILYHSHRVGESGNRHGSSHHNSGQSLSFNLLDDSENKSLASGHNGRHPHLVVDIIPHLEEADNNENVVNIPAHKDRGGSLFHNAGTVKTGNRFRESHYSSSDGERISGERGRYHNEDDDSGKYVVLGGRRYTSEDLARAFNATRPGPGPAPDRAEASTPSYDILSVREPRPRPQPPPASTSSKDETPNVLSAAEVIGKFLQHERDSEAQAKYVLDRLRSPGAIVSGTGFSSAIGSSSSGDFDTFPSSTHTSPSIDYATNYFIYPGTVPDDFGPLPGFPPTKPVSSKTGSHLTHFFDN